MKKLLLGLLAVASMECSYAQKQEAYEFKEIKKIGCTPVKSQDQTGTCWAFSAASFLESEALRLGKGEHNLSEMFVVRHMYRQKCENYVRRQGSARFSEGGLAHDLLNAVRQFGVVPESDYPGRKDTSKPYNHSRLERDLKALCDELVQQAKDGKLGPNWIEKIDAALDAEFGTLPMQFTVGGTLFMPLTYRDFLGINPNDYVNVTSFSHHPFNEPFILEVPDNWAHGSFYNLPLSDLMYCLNSALQHGYSVEWDADVSNNGFSAQNGLAIVPEKMWADKNTAEQKATFKYYEPEKNVTQAYRQRLFDQQETQDDHLMHIVGILDEGHSGAYYMVKNSWGEVSNLKGFVYVSDAYMRLNTLSFTMHKDALPAEIRTRLGLGPVGRNQAAFRPRKTDEVKQANPGKTPQGGNFQRLRGTENPKAAPSKNAKESDN